ncbi:MAG: alanine:cation symporter family protein [Planctomycetes bacterium]|nr:alanine:cation symporter family protein [Planctomycetota bacterium]
MVQSNSMTIAFVDQFATRKYHEETPLILLNNGEAIGEVDGVDFFVDVKDGRSLAVDVTNNVTVGDFLYDINNHPDNSPQFVSAQIAMSNDRIEIIDLTQGDSTFKLRSPGGVGVLKELGFIDNDGAFVKFQDTKIVTFVSEKILLKSIIGVIIALVVGLVIIGGIRRIGKVAGKLVPIMSSIYVAGALFIIVCHFTRLPYAFGLIFKHAFTPTSAVGGFAGATVLYTITWGVRRAAFSNEAGLGSAPIAHAAAKTKEPVREGLVAMLGPLIDTIIICTMTALVIIITGEWTSSAESSVLTKNAFNTGIPHFGGSIVAIGLILFAVSTAISWSYYGDRCAEYLFGKGAIIPYRWVYVGALFVGAVMKLEFVWNFSDITLGLMALPNIIAIIALSGVVGSLTKDYFSRRHVRYK